MPVISVTITLTPDEDRDDSIVVTATDVGHTETILEQATEHARQVLAAALATREPYEDLDK